jgi:hypothetical protein
MADSTGQRDRVEHALLPAKTALCHSYHLSMVPLWMVAMSHYGLNVTRFEARLIFLGAPRPTLNHAHAKYIKVYGNGVSLRGYQFPLHNCRKADDSCREYDRGRRAYVAYRRAMTETKGEDKMKRVTKYSAIALCVLFGVASVQAAEPRDRKDVSMPKNPTELKAFYDWDGNLVMNAVGDQKGDPRQAAAARYVITHVKPFINDAMIVDLVKTRDTEMHKLHQRQLDTLDIAWLDRTDPYLIDSRQNNKVSDLLRKKVDELNGGPGGAKVGPVEEIFVNDIMGFNVAETDLTHDMNQGDETKYWKSIGNGPNGLVAEKVGKDDIFPHISQVSIAIKDSATGQSVGFATIGINVDKLPK